MQPWYNDQNQKITIVTTLLSELRTIWISPIFPTHVLPLVQNPVRDPTQCLDLSCLLKSETLPQSFPVLHYLDIFKEEL